MERPNILEIKIDTQEEILRPMTDEEYAQHLIDAVSTEATND